MKRLVIIPIIFLMVGCAQQSRPIIQNTSLATQSMQTHEFDVSKKIAFAATMSVLQDLGYNVGSADLATGFITGKSPISGGFQLFIGTIQRHVSATAFVESITEDRSRVRLNFVSEEKTSSGYGMAGGKSEAVEDATVYQQAFEKISKAIFVRKSS